MIEWKKIWEVTTWDKKFSGVDKYMQPKVIKYHYYLANELSELERQDGDIRILYTTDKVAYANYDEVMENVSEGEVVTIPWGGNVTIKYYNGRFVTADNRIATSNNKSILSNKYLYYWMLSQKEEIGKFYRGAGIKHPSMLSVLNMPIPILSLSEQNRIVGILDMFTSSIGNLKNQIAERCKQFEYYRDQLLDFEGTERIFIGDLFEFKNGLNKEKKFFGQGNPIVNYTDVYHNNRITSETLKGRVTLDDNEIERFRVQRGDVFFTRTSETPEEIGYAAVLLDDINNCTFSGFLLRARPTTNLLLPEYCCYCFSSFNIRQAIIKKSTYTTRALTNGTSLSKIKIPVPSHTEQSRIVTILNTFETSIANLEAQLKLREKQYEYYRNKLLTFE